MEAEQIADVLRDKLLADGFQRAPTPVFRPGSGFAPRAVKTYSVGSFPLDDIGLLYEKVRSFCDRQGWRYIYSVSFLSLTGPNPYMCIRGCKGVHCLEVAASIVDGALA
jgi:hypothetical protein